MIRAMPIASMKLGNDVVGGDDGPLFVIAGPCVIESEELVLRVAGELKQIAEAQQVPLVFKASFDKANRSALSAFRGPGLEEGLRILEKVRAETGLPVLSDVHEAAQCEAAGQVLDVLQIPAFLCRQTDLLVAAAATGKIVNVKKGQFLAPWDMSNVVTKVVESGNANLWLTERGAAFGYNTLVVDMRAVPQMRALGYPVVFDGGHSVQQPGGLGTATGGDRTMIPTLAKAAMAAGADGFFCETHPDPDHAKSGCRQQLPARPVRRSDRRAQAGARRGTRRLARGAT
ncbi:MAG: 3-deoxy-8-phosphooctulonate synthase [Planctomycetota bacterium]|jgi:2-dehydro-3-deoxyphosphooctonate aldolase (KDO 8-P synthase)